jgi:hypothetical protein
VPPVSWAFLAYLFLAFGFYYLVDRVWIVGMVEGGLVTRWVMLGWGWLPGMELSLALYLFVPSLTLVLNVP